MSIYAEKINKSFGRFSVLRDVCLKVETGELLALLGPSGSGKTTLLRILAGLEQPDSGAVYLNEAEATFDHAGKRDVGFVFQHYALFRHLTVFENVAFGLRVKPRAQRPSRRQVDQRVRELLHLVQLESLADRFPWQLSGGQRQRIALARALAVEPKVLLLDEPFGALDAKVRKELRRWLRRLHQELRITSVFVTHDQEEALEVAHRVAVMHDGRIEQIGTPEEIYDTPVSPFVYNFLGNVNLFHGRIESGKARVGSLEFEAPHAARAEDGTPAIGYVRPYDLAVERVTEPPAGDAIEADVAHISLVGAVARLELRRCDNGQIVEAEVTRDCLRDEGFKAGERVSVRPRKLRVFAEDYSI